MLLCGATALGQDEARDVYPPELSKRDPALMQRVDALPALLKAADPGPGVKAFDRLLVRAGDPAIGGALVLVTPRALPSLPGFADKPSVLKRGLRARLLTLAAALPAPVLAALKAQQTATAALALRSQRPPSRERLIAAFPLAKQGGRAALAAWAQAFEAADLPACRSLSRLLRRFHPASAKPLAAREALLAGAAKPRTREARAPRFPVRLVETSRHALPARAAAIRERHVPGVPTWIGDRIAVSNGAAVLLFDAKGKALGGVPLDRASAGKPPPESSRFQGWIASWGDVGFAAQALESWLTPSRATSGKDGDPTFAGRYYSLVAFDARRGKLLWWDGDVGPALDPQATRQPPPGGRLAKPAVRARLAQAHVLATAADARRVYVAFTTKSEDPELRVMAYERSVRNGRLALRPAWPTAAFVGSCDRKGSSEDELVAPELAAALALDGAGRIVVTTDVRLTACLDVRRGDLLWSYVGRRPDPPRRRRSPFRPARGGPQPEYPPVPARFLTHPKDGGLAVFLAGKDVVAVRAWDGAPGWRRPRGTATRLLLGDGWVLAYGARELRGIGVGGRERFRHRGSRMEECVGRGVLNGDTLFLPTRGMRGYRVQRLQVGGGGASMRRNGAWPLPRTIQAPVNLLQTSYGFAAASPRYVMFVKWVE